MHKVTVKLDEPTHIPGTVTELQRRSARIGFRLACENRTGALLRTLAASKPEGRLLELGTGTGVGTAWLLDGMTSGALLTTVERDRAVAAIAHDVLGGDGRVRFEVADAVDWLRDDHTSPFDLVFVDCRPGKFTHRGLLLTKLARGALYLGDDLRPQPTWPSGHQARVHDFVREIVEDSRLHVTLLDWASGVVLGTRR